MGFVYANKVIGDWVDARPRTQWYLFLIRRALDWYRKRGHYSFGWGDGRRTVSAAFVDSGDRTKPEFLYGRTSAGISL